MPESPDDRIPWPHAPVHRLTERGIYFVTAATLDHEHHFRTRERLELLHRGLLTVCVDHGWRLAAGGMGGALESLSLRR